MNWIKNKNNYYLFFQITSPFNSLPLTGYHSPLGITQLFLDLNKNYVCPSLTKTSFARFSLIIGNDGGASIMLCGLFRLQARQYFFIQQVVIFARKMDQPIKKIAAEIESLHTPQRLSYLLCRLLKNYEF